MKLPTQAEFDAEMKRLLDRATNAGLQAARKWSKGNLTYRDMRKEDHPYAARHAFALRDPTMINTHRGVFLAAWKTTPAKGSAFAMQATIENASPFADLLDKGTRFMHKRPVRTRVEKAVEDYLMKYTAAAVRRAFA